MTPRTALIALHLSVALFGLAALFGKWIALPATLIVLGRTAIASVTLALAAGARSRSIGAPERAMIVNGAILAVHWVSFFAAVQISSVAIGLLGYASFPVFVLLLERRPSTRADARTDRVAVLLALAGLVLIVPAFSWSSVATRGLVLGVLSGFTFAWLTVRNRRFVADRSPLRLALWQNAFAALCLLPIAAIADWGHAAPQPIDLALLVVLGVVCTGVAHTLFIASMRHVSARTASVVAALEPVYGITLAAALLHAIPDPRTIAGGMLIVVAALIASRKAGIGGAHAVSVASQAETRD